jgi:integrase
MIGKLLGHTQVQTTARYAHLAADPMMQAANTIGHTIAGAMQGKPKAEVVPLRRGEK